MSRAVPIDIPDRFIQKTTGALRRLQSKHEEKQLRVQVSRYD